MLMHWNGYTRRYELVMFVELFYLANNLGCVVKQLCLAKVYYNVAASIQWHDNLY